MKNSGFCNPAIHPFASSNPHPIPSHPIPSHPIPSAIPTHTTGWKSSAPKPNQREHCRKKKKRQNESSLIVVLVSVAVVVFVVPVHYPVPPQLPPVPLVRVEVVLVELGNHAVRRRLIVALQVAFERHILKLVFHLIGYRLWV
jgi:hypothetical protein